MPPAELDLNQGWSIGEEAFAELVRRLRSHAPSQLVECGSGISTVRLAQALPGTSITSLEHLPEWKERAEQLLEKYGCDNARVLATELMQEDHGGANYRSYAIPEGMPERIDALIIDGPPVFIVGGREAMLYRLYDRLVPGGLVILDDARRKPERRAVRHWRSAFARGFREDYSPAGNGLSFLVKRRDVDFEARSLIALEQRWAVLTYREESRPSSADAEGASKGPKARVGEPAD